MPIRPQIFTPDVEAAYRHDRTPGVVATARGAAGFAAVVFLIFGVWETLIDPGSLAQTWPWRLGVAIAFIALLGTTYRPWTLSVGHILLATGFAIASFGFALIVAEVETGFIAGVPGFIVAVSAISVGPVTHRAALSTIAVACIPPILVYVVLGATGTEVVNLFMWLASAAGFVYLAWRVTDDARRKVFLAERDLAAQHDRIDSLIRKMVPGSIADRLKQGESDISDRHPNVTVLFVDIVGFTRYSESHDADQIVGLLNSLFSRFDQAVADHGLEKIKTLGDGYMVAGGAPLARPDHAIAATELAIDLRSGLADFRRQHNVDWEARIGIHSGPVVAGVIGTERYAYDMWGDTVNIASRLESTGTAGEIHISSDTASQLDSRFDLEPLGPIELKNRASVEAFLLLARNPD